MVGVVESEFDGGDLWKYGVLVVGGWVGGIDGRLGMKMDEQEDEVCGNKRLRVVVVVVLDVVLDWEGADYAAAIERFWMFVGHHHHLLLGLGILGGFVLEGYWP